MDSEITSSAMQRLLGVNKVTLNDLAKRGIVVRGERKGSYVVEASVPRSGEYHGWHPIAFERGWLCGTARMALQRIPQAKSLIAFAEKREPLAT